MFMLAKNLCVCILENEVLSWFEGLNMAKYCRPFVERVRDICLDSCT